MPKPIETLTDRLSRTRRFASVQVRRLPAADQDHPDGDGRRAAVLQERPSPSRRQRARLPHGAVLGAERRGAAARERPRGN